MSQTIFDEVRDAIVLCGGEPILSCMQCGLCSALCPWGRMEEKSPFNIRSMIHMGRLGYEGYESDDFLYACTTCNLCAVNCPRGVKIPEIVRSMRSVICETGGIPKNLKAVVGSINSNGNPWSQERSERTAWMKDLNVPAFTPDTEYLLFVCCTSAYDGRSQKIARAIVQLLQAAGVDFGVIGAEEQCCGEATRKIGAEEEFGNLARYNIDLFNNKGVKKIITTSPHCYHTFKNEYPEFGAEFEVLHYTELLDRLLAEGKLKPAKPVAGKAIYHEPCYLGRHNHVYDAPRDLLGAVPGLEVAEFDQNHDASMCCGGGGARIWMETKAGQRFSDVKVLEAADKEASLLVTACPYCIVMLEDSLKNLNKDEQMAVKDISEVLQESL
ncbi:(Fe-S)-binding protein [Desulfotomaculum copahuensis]|uniref:Cyclic nucleotide-binding protein n=1 Tax=Desulfotomaculum copahuensis TaxID=1838280 RepID=A0A1B7LEL2_9FIRM|nr:(Fe-S)-binding protein [Desulfotomaculum copahuensis]OAT81730.1 cyclic nucleotide-binding protein [Desulfotomaculum copahuensis]